MPASVSAILVFGAPLTKDGRPGPALARRLDAAIDASRRWPAAPVIVSGGPVKSPMPEAQAMRAALAASGVPAARLIVEDQARSTLDTVMLIAPLLDTLKVSGPIAIVTSGYHAFRCRMLLAAAGIRVGATVTPPDERRRMGSRPWGIAILREAVALPWCLLRQCAKRRTRE